MLVFSVVCEVVVHKKIKKNAIKLSRQAHVHIEDVASNRSWTLLVFAFTCESVDTARQKINFIPPVYTNGVSLFPSPKPFDGWSNRA